MSTVDAAARVLRRDWRLRREIVSPEGVPLTVELAEFSERAVALLIDLVILIVCAIVLILMSGLFFVKGASGAILIAVVLLVVFFLRNVYFIHFELSGNGATPGKRVVGIRVADRRGGPLLPSAVIARNLTREIEVFIPVGILLTAPSSAGGAFHWEYLLLVGWLVCFAALMLFNRDRMRAGDLIAGTMVIALPRQRLLGDLVEARARYVFADSQLKAYGARELQVLEDLLRRPDMPDGPVLLRDVCDRICRKIDWKELVPPADTMTFLRDFYTAQRAYLEREQLFGRPRVDKFHAPGQRD